MLLAIYPCWNFQRHIPQHIMPVILDLVQACNQLPCASQHTTVKDITKEGWLSRLLAERWEEKLRDWNRTARRNLQMTGATCCIGAWQRTLALK